MVALYLIAGSGLICIFENKYTFHKEREKKDTSKMTPEELERTITE